MQSCPPGSAVSAQSLASLVHKIHPQPPIALNFSTGASGVLSLSSARPRRDPAEHTVDEPPAAAGFACAPATARNDFVDQSGLEEVCASV